jgi:hypothetical protein
VLNGRTQACTFSGFVRLREMSLSYTLPTLISKTGVFACLFDNPGRNLF